MARKRQFGLGPQRMEQLLKGSNVVSSTQVKCIIEKLIHRIWKFSNPLVKDFDKPPFCLSKRNRNVISSPGFDMEKDFDLLGKRFWFTPHFLQLRSLDHQWNGYIYLLRNVAYRRICNQYPIFKSSCIFWELLGYIKPFRFYKLKKQWGRDEGDAMLRVDCYSVCIVYSTFSLTQTASFSLCTPF